MSYSLESKKRKFHRVLDSISNSTPQKPSGVSTPTKQKACPASNAATPDSVVTPTIKRVRLTPRSGREDSAVRPSLGLSRRPSESPGPSPRPNFVPWDRTRFLERLKTFRRVDRWSPKPSAINEVQWAKRGWSCTDNMRVECVGGCGQTVVVKLPDEIDELEEYDSDKIEERKQVRARLVEEYSKLIATGHGEKCPWRKTGCDDTIQRLPLLKIENALQGLETRYTNLLALGDKLPSLETLELPEKLNIHEILKIIPLGMLIDVQTNDTEKTPDDSAGNGESRPASAKETTTVNNVAFALALFGWDVCGDAGAGLASCDACFRRLGLWMYKPKKDGRSSIYAHLNVVNEHLEYCPWINAKSQTGQERKSGNFHNGWELLEQSIQATHRRKLWLSDSTSRPATPSPAPEDDVDNDAKKAKDKAWWARIRRIQQALHVGGSKKVKQTPVTKRS